jgi:hypothetical protein
MGFMTDSCDMAQQPRIRRAGLRKKVVSPWRETIYYGFKIGRSP